MRSYKSGINKLIIYMLTGVTFAIESGFPAFPIDEIIPF